MFSSADDLMLQTVNNLDSACTVYIYSIPMPVCMYSIITHACTVEADSDSESEVPLLGLMFTCTGFIAAY